MHDRNYYAVRNELMIKFTPFTAVLEEGESNIVIPHHKFELLSLDRLEERNNKRDYLIDKPHIFIKVIKDINYISKQ